jgi:hypothetical protein
MRSSCVLVAAVVLGPALARTPARAQTTTLHASGAWETYLARTESGQPMCAITTRYRDGRSIYLKWFANDTHLTVQVFRAGWSIPPGATARLILRFDRGTPWSVQTASLRTRAAMVEFTINPDAVRAFTRDFTVSRSMVLEFASGSEAPWLVDLTGNSPALDKLVQCIETVAGPGNPRQPYAYLHGIAPPESATTQPFDPRPVPPPSRPATDEDGPVKLPE